MMLAPYTRKARGLGEDPPPPPPPPDPHPHHGMHPGMWAADAFRPVYNVVLRPSDLDEDGDSTRIPNMALYAAAAALALLLVTNARKGG